jgi:hypothetical protein
MTPIEIIALIFAIAILLKLVLFFWVFKPAMVKNIVEKMFKKTILLTVCFLILAAVLLGLLLQELNIFQIVTASLFGMLVFGLTLVMYPKSYMKLVDDVIEHKKKAWLPWLVFVLLAVWVLIATFV